MNPIITRRRFSSCLAIAAAGLPFARSTSLPAEGFSQSEIAPFRTPFKYGKLVLAASADPNSFDSKSVDDPFVFFDNGVFQMLYIVFDGTGYQTGLAKSTDLVNWDRVACVARRDPNSKYTKYNVALSCIVRENGLTSL